MSMRALAGAILSLFLAGPAIAGTQGWYVSLEGGANAVSDWEHTRTKWTRCGTEVKDATAAFDTGWAAFGAAGFGMQQWRVELEGGFRDNDIGSYVKESGWHETAVVAPAGRLSEASAMVNVIYDVPVLEQFSLAIGLGAGADYARFKLDTPWQPVDEEDWHFAYQGLAGLNYALTQATVVFVNYRYANVRDVRYQPTPAVTLEGEDFEKHTGSAGVRFALAAPAVFAPVPQPPATPAPVPLEREFMVFFGFNKWSLSPAALATIKQAAGSVRASGSAAIRVVGHTDRAGSIAYNKALSLRRAKSVETALIAEGIAGEAISISGRGESEPMVPTADGVRESQNRRVHISF